MTYKDSSTKARGRRLLARGLCLLVFLGIWATKAEAQANSHRLVDHVEVKLEITELRDTLCSLKFLEEWVIDPGFASISKEVIQWDSCCRDIIQTLPSKNGIVSFRNITYEFHLLDPHLVASGNQAFPEPDSMDEPTRHLQEDLIALVAARSDAEKRYSLPEQLLSVIFEEDWSMDLSSQELKKRIRGITPVIWQRRQTKEGDPVNEAETGLPVYYKLELQQIPLRNP